jgi:FixJ family two-component response regulator
VDAQPTAAAPAEDGDLSLHCFASVTTLLEQMFALIDGCILLDDTTYALDGLELLTLIRRVKGSFRWSL